MSTLINIVNWNSERCGWDKLDRRHRFEPVIEHLTEIVDVAGAPDILFMTECTHFMTFAQRPLWEFVDLLNRLLPGKSTYYPFIGTLPGRTNPPGLFVNSSVVRPIEYYVPGNDWTSDVNNNLLLANVAGVETWIKKVHWDGSQGPGHFLRQASSMANLAGRRVLAAGDFNCTSSMPGEVIPDNWTELNTYTRHKLTQKAHLVVQDGRRTWQVHTEPIDTVEEAGFQDAGNIAGDFTVTVNDGIDNGGEMRIDRIMATSKLLSQARFVPGSYRVYTPEAGKEVSDHRAVSVSMMFD